MVHQKEKKKKINKKEIKGKNKPNNKFLQSKNSSLNLPPHLKNKEFSISQSTDKTNQDRITNNKKDLLSLKESEEEEDSEKSSETISENQNQIEPENKKLSKREEKMKENWRIYRKGAGVIWQDESLNEWPENDIREVFMKLVDTVKNNTQREIVIANKESERAIYNRACSEDKNYFDNTIKPKYDDTPLVGININNYIKLKGNG